MSLNGVVHCVGVHAIFFEAIWGLSMNFLRNIQIRQRLWSITILVLIGFTILFSIALYQLKSELLSEKGLQTQKLVEATHSILSTYYQLAQQGTISEAEAKTQALAVIKSIRYDEDNYFWINDMQARMVMHPIKPKLNGKDLSNFKDPNGKKLFAAFAEKVNREGKGIVPYLWPKPGNDEPVEKVSFVKGFKPWGWIIGTGIYIDDVSDTFWSHAKVTGTIGAVLIIILAAISGIIGRSIVCPLNSTTKAMQNIAAGDGDLTQKLPVQGADEITQLSSAFNEFTEKIRFTIASVDKTTSQLSESAEHLKQASDQNKQSINNQELETQQVATAVTEMTATVKNVAQNTDSAASAANDANREATEGQRIVSETVTSISSLSEKINEASSAMETLEEESSNIGSVLDVIRGIAEQTNLLALNAAIEAARAGEQGRGFAVVADEVRTLASRTQQSTDDIQKMIVRLQNGTHDAATSMNTGRTAMDETVEKANQASQSLMNIVEAVIVITDMNTQIASAAEEQHAVASEIDKSVVTIADLSQGTSKSMERSHQEAINVANLGNNLKGLIKQFSI